MNAGLVSVPILGLLLSGCSVYKSNAINGATGTPDLGVGDAGATQGQDAGSSAAGSAAPEQTETAPPVEGTAPMSATGAATACMGGSCWWSTDAAAPGCSTAGLPTLADRPRAALDGATSLNDIYLGWSRIRIGETDLTGQASQDAWQTFGVDLDGRCTNSSSCPNLQNVQSCRASTDQIPFDGALCRDNTFASLQPVAAAVPEIGQRFGISESVFNCNLWRGSYTMALRVSGYDGLANDSDVRVDFYVATGLVRGTSWQCPLENFAKLYPLWLAGWAWNVDSATLDGPVQESGVWPRSKLADEHAYVRNGYLVARMPDDGMLRLAADGTQFRGWAMKLQGGLWMGHLVRGQDQRWRVEDGLLAGRLRSADLVQSFRQLGLCEGVGLDGFYTGVQDYARENADVLADGSVDEQQSCDAMSVGIAFEAAQLTPGPVVDAIPLVECCEPGVAIADCNPVCGDGRLNGQEHCDTAIPQGQPGACPTACTTTATCMHSVLKGSGCDTQCEVEPITMVGPQDRCCPEGANATSDKDCTTSCGNGVVEPGETCDPSGSCPTCKLDDACLTVTITGAAESCNVSCNVQRVQRCMAGDGCCPSGCSSATDGDCSASCGDGRLDAAETCERTGDKVCPVNCDDQDPCTQDFQSGTPATCDMKCTHLPITQTIVGDKCCPMGANANSDSDCTPICGNTQVEGTEQCDDGNTQTGDGCGADCKNESTVDQCLSKLDNSNPECSRCTCENCEKQVLRCYAAKDAVETTQCVAVARCGLAQGCSSTDCYCGDISLAICLLGTANGKCKSEIEMAARSGLPGDIVVRSQDLNFPLGRANDLATCAKSKCASVCKLQ